jgi:hypothetical protein
MTHVLAGKSLTLGTEEGRKDGRKEGEEGRKQGKEGRVGRKEGRVGCRKKISKQAWIFFFSKSVYYTHSRVTITPSPGGDAMLEERIKADLPIHLFLYFYISIFLYF